MKHPLHTKLLNLVLTERRIKVEILNFLEKAEALKYYVPQYRNLFEYCRKELRYSDSETQRRIDAMRILRRKPHWKVKVEQDKISVSQLSELNKIDQQLKKEGKDRDLDAIIDKLENKSVRETQEILRNHFDLPIRKKISLNVEDDTYQKWVSLKNRNHKLSDDKLMNLMIEATNKLQNEPVSIRVEVQAGRSPTENLRIRKMQEAGWMCEWPGCKSTHHLQIDHIQPWALGGKTELSNLQVLCQTHNLLKGSLEFHPRRPVL